MNRYIITEKQLDDLIQFAGDEVRGAHGSGSMEKAEERLDRLERKIEKQEVPDWATHFTDCHAEGCQCEEIP